MIASDRINIVSDAQPLSFIAMEMLFHEFDQIAKIYACLLYTSLVVNFWVLVLVYEE